MKTDLDRKILTTVKLDDESCYEITTITRECSSPVLAGHYYNETFVWSTKIDEESLSRVKDNIIHQYEDSKGSLEEHFRVCSKIYKYGIESLEDED